MKKQEGEDLPGLDLLRLFFDLDNVDNFDLFGLFVQNLKRHRWWSEEELYFIHWLGSVYMHCRMIVVDCFHFSWLFLRYFHNKIRFCCWVYRAMKADLLHWQLSNFHQLLSSFGKYCWEIYFLKVLYFRCCLVWTEHEHLRIIFCVYPQRILCYFH